MRQNRMFTSVVAAREVVTVVADASFSGIGGVVVLDDIDGVRHVHIWSMVFNKQDEPAMRALGIHHLELFALANTYLKYAHLMQGSIITMMSDNASTVAATGRARARTLATAEILTVLFETAHKNDCCIARVDHIRGIDNTVSNCASRDGLRATANMIKLADPNVTIHTTQVRAQDEDWKWLIGLAKRALAAKE